MRVPCSHAAANWDSSFRATNFWDARTAHEPEIEDRTHDSRVIPSRASHGLCSDHASVAASGRIWDPDGEIKSAALPLGYARSSQGFDGLSRKQDDDDGRCRARSSRTKLLPPKPRTPGLARPGWMHSSRDAARSHPKRPDFVSPLPVPDHTPISIGSPRPQSSSKASSARIADVHSRRGQWQWAWP